MTERQWRPPSHFIHDKTGVPLVIISPRMADKMFAEFEMSQHARVRRGEDPEIDGVVGALRFSANWWRASAGESISDPEPAEMGELKWRSTLEAAGQLGITDSAVRLACRSERLPAQLIGGRWVISQDDIDRYKSRDTSRTRRGRNANGVSND